MALTGKGGDRRPIRLGRWRWPLLGYCLFVTSLSFFVPMIVVLQAAFAKAWGRGFSLDNLTLRNVRFVLFDQPATRTATWNTFVYAAAASLIALGLALFTLSYAAARSRASRPPRAGPTILGTPIGRVLPRISGLGVGPCTERGWGTGKVKRPRARAVCVRL